MNKWPECKTCQSRIPGIWKTCSNCVDIVDRNGQAAPRNYMPVVKNMNIKDATRTKGGYPYRFYADDGKGCKPVHGAYFKNNVWNCDSWTMDGRFYYVNNIESPYDLDLTDWRDQIPWEHLSDQVKWVFFQEGYWYTCTEEPKKINTCYYSGTINILLRVKMPQPPADWREAIARRPK